MLDGPLVWAGLHLNSLNSCGYDATFAEDSMSGEVMKDLVTYMAQALVDKPDEVEVTEVAGEQTSVIELKVAREDLGQSDRQAGPHGPGPCARFSVRRRPSCESDRCSKY